MAVPEKPLELDKGVNELTLEDAALFDTDEWKDNPMGTVNKLRKFLIKHSISWTKQEINAMEIGELAEIATQLGEAIQRQAVPLSS
jgi:hypothetical protein